VLLTYAPDDTVVVLVVAPSITDRLVVIVITFVVVAIHAVGAIAVFMMVICLLLLW